MDFAEERGVPARRGALPYSGIGTRVLVFAVHDFVDLAFDVEVVAGVQW
jgi:hypothetical protein